MTVQHIVLLKFKPEVTEQQIENIMQAIENLQQVLPQILSYKGGANNSGVEMDRGYTHGFIMEFDTVADVKSYFEHPIHLKLVEEMLAPATVDGLNTPIIFDFSS